MSKRDSLARRISKVRESLRSDTTTLNEKGLALVQSLSEEGLCRYLDCFGALRELANLGAGSGFDLLSNRQWNELAKQLPEEQIAIMRLVEDYAHSRALTQEQEQLLATLCS